MDESAKLSKITKNHQLQKGLLFYPGGEFHSHSYLKQLNLIPPRPKLERGFFVYVGTQTHYVSGSLVWHDAFLVTTTS